MEIFSKSRLTENIIPFILLGLLTTFIFSATHAFAADASYVPLSGVPQLDKAAQSASQGNGNLAGYLNMIYIIVIGLGALLAVIKIAYAGVKYTMSDIVTNKEEAKKDITGALLGLAILLLPYVVLHTINPNLTNLNILTGVKPVDTTPQNNSVDTLTNEQVKSQYPNVIDTTVAKPNSVAYISFISSCSSKQGKVILTGNTAAGSTLECRTKGSSGSSATSPFGTGGGGTSNPDPGALGS